MVRDPGWYMLDAGRGIERALQVVALLRVTVVRERAPETDRMVAEAVLTASESIVTYRRRYRGRSGPEALVELLVVDQHNPRSVAYQLTRILGDLQALPATSPTARPLRLLETLVETVRTADPDALVAGVGGRRPGREGFLAELHDQLRDLSDAVRTQYQQQPPAQQPLADTSSWGGTP
jgi:uncharacterized alpha-E superfamily protein